MPLTIQLEQDDVNWQTALSRVSAACSQVVLQWSATMHHCTHRLQGRQVVPYLSLPVFL